MTGLAAGERALVLHLRPSRRKARAAAVAEVATVLEDLGGRPLPGGPLSEVPGVAWVAVGPAPLDRIAGHVARLGYTEAIELVVPAAEVDGDPEATWTRARWRGEDVVLVPVHAEPAEALRAEAPDRRSFLLECGDGVTRRIAGYRGGRGALEHRALPPADARLLVNLVQRPAHGGGGTLLDPFAGAGGVVLQAVRAGWTPVSADVDPTLRHGLAELSGGRHVVAGAAALPLGASSVDAVATEPPYHGSATATVVAAVAEAARVLRPGGRLAMLVATAQAPAVRAAAGASGLAVDVDVAVDRKGTDVTCLRMVRS